MESKWKCDSVWEVTVVHESMRWWVKGASLLVPEVATHKRRELFKSFHKGLPGLRGVNPAQGAWR